MPSGKPLPYNAKSELATVAEAGVEPAACGLWGRRDAVSLLRRGLKAYNGNGRLATMSDIAPLGDEYEPRIAGELVSLRKVRDEHRHQYEAVVLAYEAGKDTAKDIVEYCERMGIWDLDAQRVRAMMRTDAFKEASQELIELYHRDNRFRASRLLNVTLRQLTNRIENGDEVPMKDLVKFVNSVGEVRDAKQPPAGIPIRDLMATPKADVVDAEVVSDPDPSELDKRIDWSAV